jgi:hypothetical protein
LTAAGPASPAGGLDISGISRDATVRLRVRALVGRARLLLEDSVNGFANSLPHAICDLDAKSGLLDGVGIERVWRKSELSSVRFGVASAVLRWNIAAVSSGGGSFAGSIELESWLET